MGWIRKNINCGRSSQSVISETGVTTLIRYRWEVTDLSAARAGLGEIGPDANRIGLRGSAGRLYRRSQDDSKFQPLRVYVPLLAHNSGLGGLASSERSVATIWNQLIRHPCEPRPNLSRLLLCGAVCGGTGIWA